MISDRLLYALLHPWSGPMGADVIDRYREIERQPDGNLLCSILAVDR